MGTSDDMMEMFPALLWEVDPYLDQAGSDVADRFVADFSPDIDAEAFPGCIAGFLRDIRRALP